MLCLRSRLYNLSFSLGKVHKGKQGQNAFLPGCQYQAYSSMKDRNSWVVLSDDGKIICCWHPEEAPPYEHTKPLPKMDPEFLEGDSVLKVQYRRDAKYRFKPDGPTIPELAKMTYTTKHRWYPNNEKKYLDPNPPVDR
ncbi:39S ribosomal protein L42, mitochondrial, partial [Stegodyphus mimosarum]